MVKFKFGQPLKNCLKCKSCGREFIPIQSNQIYCGSKVKKTGCSWLRYKEYQRDYSRTWKRKQREMNSPYAERQKISKRGKAQTFHGKEIIKEWRKRNIKKILEWNRKYSLKKKGIEGSHTEEEWTKLKEKNGFRCVKCGLAENELKVIWEGTTFTELTKDHIIPLSKGGTDNIDNILPLCISCNARKKDREPIVVAVSGFWNPIHVGHIHHFKGAKKLGDILIVFMQSDDHCLKKSGYVFYPFEERKEILEAIQGVDKVVEIIDSDMTVSKTLEKYKPKIFVKGGDRTPENIPEEEKEVCKKYGIEVKYDNMGGKLQSSSWLVDKFRKK